MCLLSKERGHVELEVSSGPKLLPGMDGNPVDLCSKGESIRYAL